MSPALRGIGAGSLRLRWWAWTPEIVPAVVGTDAGAPSVAIVAGAGLEDNGRAAGSLAREVEPAAADVDQAGEVAALHDRRTMGWSLRARRERPSCRAAA
jgi:hypothetical protein